MRKDKEMTTEEQQEANVRPWFAGLSMQVCILPQEEAVVTAILVVGWLVVSNIGGGVGTVCGDVMYIIIIISISSSSSSRMKKDVKVLFKHVLDHYVWEHFIQLERK